MDLIACPKCAGQMSYQPPVRELSTTLARLFMFLAVVPDLRIQRFGRNPSAKIIPAKGALDLRFVGLPALVLGLLLSAVDAFKKAP